MKYIITGTNEQGERHYEVLNTSTTRKSKLLNMVDFLWKRKYNITFSSLKDGYIGVLPKHTKLIKNEVHG